MPELNLVEGELLAYPIHVFDDGSRCQAAVTHQRGARSAIKFRALSALFDGLDHYIFAPGTRNDILQIESKAYLAIFYCQCQTPFR